ncbi:MAG: sulfur carrier protein ThiS [Muribaculaceae bacterium]|nr:sulfur carrier protein ThiS [Muribaculaceae bacterium]
MNITVNDVPVNLPDGATLADALASRQLPATGVATAVNGSVVPAILRTTRTLNDGDKIVVIKAFYGG